ncbi:hypothetical protein B0H10DRAFT_2170694 [Mycena sp. CBHHK59/15]|nr:hypothetical protein B0H10DRAFT_2170694 [Mycena sp. CBHHK59/15]
MLDLDAAGYWKYVEVQGLDAAGNMVAVTIPGNEAAVDTAKKSAEAWLQAEKKAHAIIVKAVPDAKLYIRTTWNALKNEYEPSNALTAVTIKQQIISYQCAVHDDPVNWREVMVQLYGKLRDADLYMMPDTDVRQGDAMGNPVPSKVVISRLKAEEVEKKIAPSIVSINPSSPARIPGIGLEMLS